MSTTSPRIRHHASFERLVLFGYRLTCRTGLHIGAGKSAELVGSDLPVLRDAAGRPLVPGSSLRGILRSGLEALSQEIDFSAFASEPGGTPAERTPEHLSRMWGKLSTIQKMFGYTASDKREKDEVGSAFGSRLQISDAVCSIEVPVELRDGVAISRETRTASGSAKFDLEVVPAETTFLGHIRFKNPLDYELGMLAQALWMLDQGMLLLGGKSARGLGWVQVEVTAPRNLEARSILFQGARPAGQSGMEDFGPVNEKLGEYLQIFENQPAEDQSSAGATP